MKELLERFKEEKLPMVKDSDGVEDAFDEFWTLEKKKAFKELSENENLNFEKLVAIVSEYLFTGKPPQRDEVIKLMNERPSLKDRKPASKRIKTKIIGFVETFIKGMG